MTLVKALETLGTCKFEQYTGSHKLLTELCWWNCIYVGQIEKGSSGHLTIEGIYFDAIFQEF